jgi:hypothetical protein
MKSSKTVGAEILSPLLKSSKKIDMGHYPFDKGYTNPID